ncbi:MAG: Uma2 family endonuclease [Defluviitaleaceae bacterium]|nr:Uma2 family endonuclease [Defluviitaleaceae bacterium]
MSYYPEMAVTGRHRFLATKFFVKFYNLLPKSYVSKGDLDLVYYGNLREYTAKLVDISAIKDVQTFLTEDIYQLRSVQPDLTVFHKQPYIENFNQTKTAGRPDLVVEIWSDGNSETVRAEKFSLYSSSPVTEHWYIDQQDNEVKRFLGETELPSVFLGEIATTNGGVTVDLTDLALD